MIVVEADLLDWNERRMLDRTVFSATEALAAEDVQDAVAAVNRGLTSVLDRIEDWVARLADSIASKRALLLLSCRPGYRSPAGDRSFHTGLALSTLTDPDTLRLARGLLGADELPPASRASSWRRPRAIRSSWRS